MLGPTSPLPRPARVRTGARVGLILSGWLALALAGAGAAAAQVAPAGGAASPTHAIAMHGVPALPAGFTHFPHVNPNAPKGGQLRLGAQGSFDSLNAFIIRGQVPSGLREYVYESLMARGPDEPFTLYGLIAGHIEVPADRSAITFHLRPEARFSDERQITPADVIFTHKVLMEKGSPFLRSHYRKVARIEQPAPGAVRFVFGDGGDRELPLILGLMPILPSHRHTLETFDRTSLEPPVGSGPYTVAKIDAGRSIIYRRNPDHWGRALPVNRGRYNFDEIRIEFFRDSNALFEAFKAGEIDVRVEDDPTRWADNYDFPAVKDGRVIKREVEIGLPAGMSALVFNTRRPPFSDQRVRAAFIQLFDGEYFNRNLYQGLYRRTDSYFVRSSLAATGRPASETERRLLAPFPGAVHEEILEGRWRLPATDGSGGDRTLLKDASRLLVEAGYRLRGSALVDKAGRPLEFEFLALSRAQERLMLGFGQILKRLGIAMRVRQVDSAQHWLRMKSRDFDMAQWHWSASLSPGNEQLNRWSSAAADNEGTLNYAGVKSAAADAMIDAMLKAESREDFVAAVRAFDRVLLSGDYVIPLYHAPRQWVAHWRHVAGPERTPLTGTDLDTWWVAAEKRQGG